MAESTDDESSDSSNEFLVSPDKINLDSSFFSQTAVKTNVTNSKAESDDESENDEDFKDVTGEASAEMFSQILKNLEDSQKLQQDNEEPIDCEPAGNVSPQKLQKGKAIHSKSKTRQPNVLSQEISDLLLQGEAHSLASQSNKDDSEEGDEDDEGTTSEYKIPEEGVKITLPGTGFLVQRKKNGRTADTFIREIINRIKSNQLVIHKVGLLCWLGHGFHLNQLINEVEIMSAVQSLVTKTQYPKGHVDLSYLEKFTKWFKNLFSIKTSTQEEVINRNNLLQRIKEKKLLNYKELVLLYIATLRAMGINCRLVISLHPPDLKVSKDLLPKTKTEIDREKEKKKNIKEKELTGEEKEKSKIKSTKVSKDKDNTKIKNKSSSVVPENSLEGEKNARLEARKKAAAVLQKNVPNKHNTRSKANVVPETTPVAHRTRHAVDLKSNNRKVEEDLDSENKITMAQKLKSKISQNGKNTASSLKLSKASKTESNTLEEIKTKPSTKRKMDTDSEDDEFVPKQPLKKKAASSKSSANTKRRKNEDKLMEVEEMEVDDPETAKKREDFWAEIYVESERSWICISVMHEKINSVADVYRRATKPVLYIIAWNAEGSIKDVTRRYCPHWLTVTRKQRVHEKWWTESISAFQEKDSPISKAEDEMLLQRELEKPLPTTISECKGHPLYVLQRHLLKYEALYPPDCVPLGHLRTGEAIYSRYCVHTLYSRETWIKKARVVKPAQEPYKIVKAHLRYDKRTGMKLKDEKLELFGKWQTMDYVPPAAKNGVVPRNEYGNVDLFKQCMLPKGTVHINLPALNRVARKLNIDCAPAVVGFKFSRMGALPSFEGFVVCEEYEDVLREAWETEQVEAAKREREKREKRIYGNWKKLISGLLIRERLAAKYEFDTKKKPSEPNREKPRRKKKV